MIPGPLPIKHHSLTGRIDWPTMLQAFANVKKNRGTGGVDRVPIELFEANRDQNLRALMHDLKRRGEFQPLPLRRVYIPKPDGSQRPLSIPAVRDRVAQDVLRQLLEPLFEPRFHKDSYGFRPGRNCHQAVERVLELWRQGHKYVLDADIQGFFDTIPSRVVMTELTHVVADGNILGIVERFLKAGVLELGAVFPTRQGVPQGGVISPLLSNIALNVLDWHLHERGYRFVRYADDFVVMCETQAQAEEARQFVEHLFTERLGLRLHPEKTRVVAYQEGLDFLGFRLTSHTVTVRDSSVVKLKTRVRELTQRRHNLDEDVFKKLNQVFCGWANFFVTRFSSTCDLFRTLDRWTRMRLRCMRFKRKSRHDNQRLPTRLLTRLGLQGLQDHRRKILRKLAKRAPPHGATLTEPPGA